MDISNLTVDQLLELKELVSDHACETGAPIVDQLERNDKGDEVIRAQTGFQSSDTLTRRSAEI